MNSIFQRQGDKVAAIALGAFQNRQFLASDFVGKTFTVYPLNSPVVVAELSVPLGVTLALLPNRRTSVYLEAQHLETMSGGLATGDYVIDLGAVGKDIVQSTRIAPAFGAGIDTHPDAHAYQYNGGSWLPCLVKAINFDTNTVTVARTTGTTSIDLRFLTGNGEVMLRAVRPTGSDQANPQLFRYAFRGLHESNQINDRTAVNLDDLKELPERWKLAVEVNSNAPILFDDKARHLIALPGGYTPTKVLEKSRWDAVAEVALRGGRL